MASAGIAFLGVTLRVLLGEAENHRVLKMVLSVIFKGEFN